MRTSIAALLIVLGACSRPEAVPAPPGFDRLAGDQVAHGKRLSQVLGCTGCHGADLAGRDWSDELGTLWTANVTWSAALHTDDELKAMVVTGSRPGGRELWDMPSHVFTKLNPDELDAIVAFIRSMPRAGEVHPAPKFGPLLLRKMKEGVYRSSADKVRLEGAHHSPEAGPGHAVARHIVRATCAECHKIDLKGGENEISGQQVPDIRLMAAGYSPADFDRLLTTGLASGGREVGLMSEVARGRFSQLTAHERAAIFAYLSELGKTAAD